MSVAYVDTSCVVAVALGEKAGVAVSRQLERFDQLCASNLLEAEFRSALAREGVQADPEFLSWVSWVIPDRPLSAEFSRVLSAGRVRGADLWHLASALYVAEEPKDLPFVTLDEQQRAVARAVGFPT